MTLKRSLADIALFGGQPAFSHPLHVGQLYFPAWPDFETALRGIFARRHYANNGPLVQELDARFAAHLGVRHAVSVTNGTIALMMAAKALGLQGEVVVPAFTFPATVQILTWCGLAPVFCDVDPATHNINARLAEALVSERTCAVLGVHLWGRACDPVGLQDLCQRRGIALFYDAAHAVDCTHRGRKIGGLGRVEAFSFHATKVLNGAEGGCLTTNDDDLAARLRTMRNFHAAQSFARVPLRINGKMSEAQAAMALLALDSLSANIERNRSTWNTYRERARAWGGMRLVDTAAGEQSNYQYAVLDVDPERCPLTRNELFQLLRAENVLARRYFMPGVHKMPPYRDQFRGSLPATDDLCGRLLQLPVGAAATGEVASGICNLVDCLMARAGEIACRLRAAGSAS